MQCNFKLALGIKYILFRDSGNKSIMQRYTGEEDGAMFWDELRGVVELVGWGGLGYSCYLEVLIILLIKPSGNTCIG